MPSVFSEIVYSNARIASGIGIFQGEICGNSEERKWDSKNTSRNIQRFIDVELLQHL
jgi:hypothetical protein